MILLLEFSKSLNSVKIFVELQYLFSGHRLMVLYNCAKFHENISKGVKVIERT